MAYSHTIDLVQGDTDPQITATLRDSNKAAPGKKLDAENPETWAVINLTGATVRLKLRMIGQTELKDTLVAIITDAPSGQATFVFNEDTLDTEGQMEGEIEITAADGAIQTLLHLIRLRIRAQF